MVKFFGPDKEPTDILRSDVEAYIAWIIKTTKTTAPYRFYSVGSAWFRWMQWNDLVPLDFNPFRPFARKENKYQYTGERKRLK